MHHPVSPVISPATYYDLALADGSRWAIASADAAAEDVVAQMCAAMLLQSIPGAEMPSQQGLTRVLVHTYSPDRGPSPRPEYTALPTEDGGRCVYIRSLDPHDGIYAQMVRLSLAFAQEVHLRGGVLMHGALAERDGSGVILAAPGGRGKSTASNRLPAPWHSCCDDATLVVMDTQGNYWAHPWPTWSRFIGRKAAGGSWDVQHAVPLKAIFILDQAPEDRVEPIGMGQGVSLLVESAEQAAFFMGQGLPPAKNARSPCNASTTSARWREKYRCPSCTSP